MRATDRSTVAPLAFLCPHTVVARRSPPSAQGASEVCFLPVKKQTECPRAIRPRVKRSPQLCGDCRTQAAAIQKIVCKRACIVAEAAKGARGKAKGFSPNGCAQRGWRSANMWRLATLSRTRTDTDRRYWNPRLDVGHGNPERPVRPVRQSAAGRAFAADFLEKNEKKQLLLKEKSGIII